MTTQLLRRAILARNVVTLVAVLAVADGCGGSSSSPTAPSAPAVASAPAPAPTPAPTPTPAPAPGPQNGTLSATFDGGVWTASLALSALFAANNFAMSGSDSSGRTVSIGMRVSAPGTYAFTGTNGGSCTLIVGSATWLGAPAALQGSGEIVFTTLTANNAAGTFRCSAPAQAGTAATGTKEITNGTFNVRY